MKRFTHWLYLITGETWVYFLAFQHLLWGMSLFLSLEPLHTTGLDTLLQILPPYSAGTLFIVCALLSMWGLHRPPDYRHFLIMLPQMAILIFSAGGAVRIILQGHFATGETYPRWFLLDDQWYHIGFVFMYVLSILKHFGLLGKAKAI